MSHESRSRIDRVCRLPMLALLLLLASSAGAVPVDGRLDPEYGAARSTQTTQSSLGDTPENAFLGSELDEAFGYVSGDTLHLLLAGNFNRFFSEPLILPNQLQLYIDVGPGGQNPLSAANPATGFHHGLQGMAGLAFDQDFVPDYFLAGSREASGATPFYAFFAELPAGGGGAGSFLGSTGIGGPGTLAGSGASNPFGILASIDLSNVAGVTAGCDAASGAGVTTGIEWAIPLAALGSPAGSIRICALIARVSGEVSNQILGPVPPGTCTLGPASGVNFANLPGLQYFVVDAETPVTRTSWGRLKASYR